MVRTRSKRSGESLVSEARFDVAAADEKVREVVRPRIQGSDSKAMYRSGVNMKPISVSDSDGRGRTSGTLTS